MSQHLIHESLRSSSRSLVFLSSKDRREITISESFWGFSGSCLAAGLWKVDNKQVSNPGCLTNSKETKMINISTVIICVRFQIFLALIRTTTEHLQLFTSHKGIEQTPPYSTSSCSFNKQQGLSVFSSIFIQPNTKNFFGSGNGSSSPGE